ncbi:DUF742 domain-containing protein [Streptomyces sp. NPDC053048]|uniref:DUF742 domain-containing protein n=1 Tax=Streptomyces sp. NPDC053048 TaxID=3365694 RepID=UPI0037CF883B
MTTSAPAPPVLPVVPAVSAVAAARPRGVVGPAGLKSARVRPYSLTGGRTRCGHLLLVETFVAAPGGPPGAGDGPSEPPSGGLASRVLPEVRAIVGLCRRLRSVAEVSALLKMPLGVVRVLLSDLADQGRIRVYGTGHAIGRPDRALLERVLSGLRRL